MDKVWLLDWEFNFDEFCRDVMDFGMVEFIFEENVGGKVYLEVIFVMEKDIEMVMVKIVGILCDGKSLFGIKGVDKDEF